MKNYYLLIILFCPFLAFSQLSDWSTAPDFSLPDLDGNTHELYDYLDEGYSAVLDFSATWCGPCWNYHQNGILEEIYDDYGPGGEDKVMVFMIEADPGTTQPCIYGPANCSGGSIGDWTAGVDYPILNPGASGAATVNSDFQINYYPTLYGISPIGEVLEIGQASFGEWESWVAESFQMHNSSFETNGDDCTTSFINLTVVGGYGDVVFNWSNGSVTEDLYDIEPGEYFVTLTDDHDYDVVIGPIEIENNDGVELNLMDIGHVECFGGENGYAEVEVTGGSGDFDFTWSNGSTDEILEEVPAGEYDLVVTDIDSGCEFEISVEIEEPEALEYELEIEQSYCGGPPLGSVEFDVDGGTWPITFFYEDFNTRDEYAELMPGSYTVTIMDFNGCMIVSETFEILSNETPMAYSSASGAFSCALDSVYIAVDSSSWGPDISYQWFDASQNAIGSDSLLFVDSTGVYTLQVTDLSSGCTAISSVQVIEDFESPIALATSLNNIDCNNSSSLLTAEGSTMDSTILYSWTTQDGNILSDPNMYQIEAGSAGLYELMVSNQLNGCVSYAQVEVLSEDVPQLELIGDTQLCEGSTTELCVQLEANQELRWLVNNQIISVESCIVIDEEWEIDVFLSDTNTGCETVKKFNTAYYESPSTEINGQLEFCEDQLTTLCYDNPGQHTVSWYYQGELVGNANCLETDMAAEIELVVTEPEHSCTSNRILTTSHFINPVVEIEGQLEFCEGENTEICLQNIQALEFKWFENGNLISDQSCITIDNSTDIEVEVYDPLTGCSESEYFSTNTLALPEFEIQEPGLLGCDNASVDLVLDLQDISAYQLMWMDSNGNVLGENDNILSVSAPGEYTAVLISPESCSTVKTVVVEYNPEEVPSAEFDVSINELVSDFELLNSTNIQSIQWDFGDGNKSDSFNPTHSYSESGYYEVIVTVSNDCGSSTYTQTILALSKLQISTVNSHLRCFESNDGRIQLNIFGGLPDYKVMWLNSAVEEGTITAQNLKAGTYTIRIEDAAGQLLETEIELTQPELMSLDAEITGTSPGTSDASIFLDISGGNGNYEFLWSTGSTDQDLVNIPRGIYSVTVSDSKNCIIEEEFEVLGTTSLQELADESFILTPNPARNVFNIRTNNAISGNFDLELLSITGERVHSSSNMAANEIHTIQIDNLPAGIYIAHIRNGKKYFITRLIVQE